MRTSRYLFLFCISLFLLTSASARIDHLGTFKQGSCINLLQICTTTCTYNNISSITVPGAAGNKFAINGEFAMTKRGLQFNYTSCIISSNAGEYTVNGHGDEGGGDGGWSYTYIVTPSGFTDTATFFFIFIIIIGLVFAIGVLLKNNWIMMLGSILVLFFGFFIINNGIDLIKDRQTTWAIGIIAWALGIYFIYLSIEEALKEWR